MVGKTNLYRVAQEGCADRQWLCRGRERKKDVQTGSGCAEGGTGGLVINQSHCAAAAKRTCK
jgi:hypothetical protein